MGDNSANSKTIFEPNRKIGSITRLDFENKS